MSVYYDQFESCNYNSLIGTVEDNSLLYNTLEPSLTYNEGNLGNSDNIDTLYNTYLGSHVTEFNNCSRHNSTTDEVFQQLPIDQWNGEDCYDWANSICQLHQLDTFEVDLMSFRKTTGACLLQFTSQHFSAICGDLNSTVFYKAFQLLKKKKTGGKQLQQPQNGSSTNDGWEMTTSYPYTADSWKLSTEEFQDLDRYIPKDQNWDALPEDIFSLDLQDQAKEEDEEEEEEEEEEEQENDGNGNLSLLSDGASNAVTLKVKTTSRRKERGPKIYEFLMRLLLDPRTNPELIRWDDMTNATFVLVQPGIIAQLWGARSNKTNLTANNFARALRYHYKTGALTSVSERHYMYTCGPKSLQYLTELKRASSSSSSSDIQ